MDLLSSMSDSSSLSLGMGKSVGVTFAVFVGTVLMYRRITRGIILLLQGVQLGYISL